MTKFWTPNLFLNIYTAFVDAGTEHQDFCDICIGGHPLCPLVRFHPNNT